MSYEVSNLNEDSHVQERGRRNIQIIKSSLNEEFIIECNLRRFSWMHSLMYFDSVTQLLLQFLRFNSNLHHLLHKLL